MQILHLSSSGDFLGGAERALYELVDYEISKNHEPIVVAPNRGSFTRALLDLGVNVRILKHYPVRENIVESVTIRYVKRLVKMTVNAVGSIRMRRLMRATSPDILHINTSVVGMMLPPTTRVKPKIVWHVRELDDEFSGRRLWSRRTQCRRILEADLVLAVSSHAAQSRFGCPTPDNVTVVQDDVPYADLALEREPILGEAIVRICVVGPLTPAKGQDVAIIGAGLAAQALGRELVLDLIGPRLDASFETRLRALAAVYPRLSVRIRGEVWPMGEVLRGTDMVISSSLSEAFGLATIEAMAAGCLVVGNSRTGTGEILGADRGRTYNGGPQDLARALTDAIQDITGSRTIAERGQDHARTYLNDAGRGRIVSLFSDLAEDQRT